MSDYEKLNQRVEAQKATRHKDTLRRLSFILAIVLAVILVFVGLESIGFISEMFMMILISITVCTGAFNAGRIWDGFKR